MAFPYLEVFAVLLLVYLGYSYWQRLDPRFPVAAALVLLVATALVEAGGATDAADTLAEYVFLLLVGGVVLMLLERVRRDHDASLVLVTHNPEVARHAHRHITMRDGTILEDVREA